MGIIRTYPFSTQLHSQTSRLTAVLPGARRRASASASHSETAPGPREGVTRGGTSAGSSSGSCDLAGWQRDDRVYAWMCVHSDHGQGVCADKGGGLAGEAFRLGSGKPWVRRVAEFVVGVCISPARWLGVLHCRATS